MPRRSIAATAVAALLAGSPALAEIDRDALAAQLLGQERTMRRLSDNRPDPLPPVAEANARRKRGILSKCGVDREDSNRPARQLGSRKLEDERADMRVRPRGFLAKASFSSSSASSRTARPRGANASAGV